MSNHPLGLSEDPFADRAALTVEEASRLIQDRVSASGGDGPGMFPPETCAEIHRRTRGLPDAVRELAGRAMRIAADAGQEAVSVEHVRAAADSDPEDGATHAREQAASAKRAPRTEPEPTADATTGTGDEIDDVPDLPAFVASGIELPTEPSPDLPPDAREWVARFIHSDDSEHPRPAATQAASEDGETAPQPVKRA